MRYTKKRLAEILKSHAKWLRGESGGARADLLGADLSGADLYGADLLGADLSGANLLGADLYGANLSLAELTNANFKGTGLYNCIGPAGHPVLTAQLGRDPVFTFSEDDVRIGCETHSMKQWLREYKKKWQG